MPSPQTILDGLTALANEWIGLAIVWHLLLGGLLVMLAGGFRPSLRTFAMFIALPLVSVSALAWLAGNPFNGGVFAALSAALTATAMRLPNRPIAISGTVQLMAAALSIGFGWVYPHFLSGEAALPYLYAAPLGLIPCPTLSVLVGLTLLVDLAESRPWALTVVASALVYSLIGMFRLGVALDAGLLLGAVWLGVSALIHRRIAITAFGTP
jgi:hypothetical protein